MTSQLSFATLVEVLELDEEFIEECLKKVSDGKLASEYKEIIFKLTYTVCIVNALEAIIHSFKF